MEDKINNVNIPTAPKLLQHGRVRRQLLTKAARKTVPLLGGVKIPVPKADYVYKHMESTMDDMPIIHCVLCFEGLFLIIHYSLFMVLTNLFFLPFFVQQMQDVQYIHVATSPFVLGV